MKTITRIKIYYRDLNYSDWRFRLYRGEDGRCLFTKEESNEIFEELGVGCRFEAVKIKQLEPELEEA